MEKADAFYLWYAYDKAGRLATVLASNNNDEAQAETIATYDLSSQWTGR